MKRSALRGALRRHWQIQSKWAEERQLILQREGRLEEVQVYIREQRRQHALALSDLVVLAVEAMERYQDLATHFAGHRFAHILLDQGEELTPTQADLLCLLARAGSSLTIAADPAQAIHPEADRRALEYIGQEFSPTVVTLETRHGSTVRLAELDNTLRRELGATSIPAGQPDRVTPGGAPPREVVVQGTLLDLDNWFLSEAERLHREEVPWGDMAVLHRRGSAIDRLRLRLRHRGIPHRELGGAPQVLPTDARCVAATLASALNPRDVPAFRIAASPGYPNKSRLLPVKTLRQVREAAEEHDGDLIHAAESLLQSDEVEVDGQGRTALRCVSKCRRLTDLYLRDDRDDALRLPPFLSLLHQMVNDAKPEGIWEPEEAEMTALVELAEATPPATGENRREHLRRVLDLWSPALHPGRAHRQEGIAIARFEQAKARSWPVVFVLDVSDDATPGRSARYGARLEREGRLLYHAITRCTSQLYLCRPDDTGMGGHVSGIPKFLAPVQGMLDTHLQPYQPPDPHREPFA